MNNHHSFTILTILVVLLIQSSCCCDSASIDLSKPKWEIQRTVPSFIQFETPSSTLTISKYTLTPDTTDTVTASPTITKTVVPTTTQTVTATATGTEKPACLIQLAPPDSSTFGSFGKINFNWDANVDAASYVVVVTAPNGTVMTFPAGSTEYSRWIESFSWGGEFTWQVLALDADGNVLCRSESSRFTKPVTEPSSTAVPAGKKVKSTPGYIPTI